MSGVPQTVDDGSIGASPPLFIQQMLATSMPNSAKRKRLPSAGANTAAGTGDTVQKGDLISMVFDLESRFGELIAVLAAAPPPAIQGDDCSEAVGHTEGGTTAHDGASRAQQLNDSSARWATSVAALQQGIRSQGAVCVKRALRDQLVYEIAERERAISKMSTAIGIAKQTL